MHVDSNENIQRGNIIEGGIAKLECFFKIVTNLHWWRKQHDQHSYQLQASQSQDDSYSVWLFQLRCIATLWFCINYFKYYLNPFVYAD